MVGKNRKGGFALAGDDDLGVSPLVTAQPAKKDSPRYQVLVAAVAIPESALNEMDEEDEEDTALGKSGTTSGRVPVTMYAAPLQYGFLI